jgi:hypothetical protein
MMKQSKCHGKKVEKSIGSLMEQHKAYANLIAHHSEMVAWYKKATASLMAEIEAVAKSSGFNVAPVEQGSQCDSDKMEPCKEPAPSGDFWARPLYVSILRRQ